MNETPGTVTMRREQAAARRRQILAAARRLFAENGFRDTSIREVHRQVGVSDGLLYHYFPSKTVLLRAVLEDAVARLDQPDLAGDLPSGMAAPEALRRALRGLWQRWSENEDVLRILLREGDSLPETGDGSMALALVAPAGGLAGFLAERIERGEIRRLDPELGAQLLIDQALGLWIRQVLMGRQSCRTDPLEVLDQAVDQIWHGWRAAPGVTDA